MNRKFVNAFFVFLAFCPFMAAAQQVLTVSNNPKIPAEYQDLASAIAAASPGDWLYLHPSPEPYDGEDSVLLQKPLRIIGGDFRNSNQEFGGEATLLNKLVLTPAASGASLTGVEVSRIVFRPNAAEASFKNMTISHNNIDRIDFFDGAQFQSDSLLIRNNLVRVAFFENWEGVTTAANIWFENNVIGQVAEGAGVGLVIRNNFFMPGLFAVSAFENLKEAVVANNYFYGDSLRYGIGTATCEGVIFDHNYAFRTSDSFSGGVDNIFGTANRRNSADSGYGFMRGNFNQPRFFFRNLSLVPVAGSPLIGAGSDATDIGPMGGRFPYDLRKRHPFPHIRAVQVSNPVLGENTLLRFTIFGEYPD